MTRINIMEDVEESAPVDSILLSSSPSRDIEDTEEPARGRSGQLEPR